jgi:spore coat protein U-like protein
LLWVLAVAAGVCVLGVGADGRQERVGRDSISCTVGVSPMQFGTYDPFAPDDLDVQGHLGFHCEATDTRSALPSTLTRLTKILNTVKVKISINQGVSSSYYDRFMLGQGGQVHYQLYLDPTHLEIWGDGRRPTGQYVNKIEPDGVIHNVPIFGRIFAGQSVVAGMFVDTVVVTLDF